MKPRTAALAMLAAMGVSLFPSQEAQQERSVWDGVYTEDQAERGQPLYRKECGVCHGDLLTGGEMAPPLAGGDFLANWNGLTVGDLVERIRKTMPPNKPGKLSRTAHADITAFLLKANEFPAGETELSGRTELLQMIRIGMTKPDRNK